MKNELHILILEDVPEEAILVERALRREKFAYVSRRVDSRDGFEDALKNFEPDIVLSDHALPTFNSIEALELCRKFNPEIPFILVTGTVSEEFAVTCIKRGADDYILKSNLTRLGSAIRNALNHRETEERKRLAEAEIINQNDRLRTANEALKKMNSEMDNFVYSVSHNLRGPISSIQGVVNIAKLEYPNAELVTGKYFDMIERNVGTLNRTITEIVHYSQNARVRLKPERINLRELFDDTFEKLNYLSAAGVIDRVIELQDDFITSDRFRMGVIFQNLLSNSIRYCDP
ncbi:MAG TPA: response regulator, partial [Ohtaekwangia sp.]|nr:response regulator [Ohtaekwangia sp.]